MINVWAICMGLGCMVQRDRPHMSDWHLGRGGAAVVFVVRVRVHEQPISRSLNYSVSIYHIFLLF